METLGTMVAQMMPWMEQLLNNQVLLMARMEKIEQQGRRVNVGPQEWLGEKAN